MSKYQKKPVIIEAFRVGHDPAPEWFMDAVIREIVQLFKDGYYIVTLEGDMKAEKGDWVIKGVENEIYPCKHSIFEKTYEAVVENG